MNSNNLFSSLKTNQRYALLAIAALAVLLVLCLITLTLTGIIQNIGNLPGKGGSDDVTPDDINTYSIGATEKYNISENELYGGSLVIVNKDNKFNLADSKVELADPYEYRVAHQADANNPAYKITTSVGSKLTPATVENLHNMLTALKDSTGGVSYISTAFRTLKEQQEYSKPAASGYSDFHTGMLVSLKGYVGTTALDLTAEENASMYEWLLANAHKYGFIQRYPAGKESITGVSDYLSCFRYVGVAHATYMKSNGLCLEEYVEFLHTEKPTVDSPLRIEVKNGTQKGYYAVYFCDAKGDILVPTTTPSEDGGKTNGFTVSGTNKGGVIVTVKLK